MNFYPLANTGGNPIQVIDLPMASSENNALIEAISAVRKIASEHPAPYTLMVSGGVDSQAMLFAWYLSGVEFKAVSISYGSYNAHDIETMETFLRENDIDVKIEIKQFDVIKFLESDYPRFAKEYECSSPQICTYMKMSELIESGTVVFGGNFISLPERGGAALSHAILGMCRYAERSGRSIVPFFFLSTPELAYAFIKYDDVNDLNPYSAKCKAYAKGGFPVVQQQSKFTGFEMIKDHYDQFQSRVSRESRLEFASRPSKRAFDLIFRYPFEKLFNDPKVEFKFSFLTKKDYTQ